MGFLAEFKFWGRNPLTIVEIIIAIISIVGGLYVMSPILAYSIAINGTSGVAAVITAPLPLIGFGFVHFASGAMMLSGIFQRSYRLRSLGLFVNILTRIYALIGGFVLNGLLPLTWLSPFGLLLICLVCYATVKGFILRGDI